MDTVLAIRAFIETVESGGFSSAARRLGVAPSVVMKRVNHLEHVTKSTLLRRTTREVRLTEAGMRSLDSLRRVVREMDDVLDGLRRADDAPLGRLRIGTPPALTAMHLATVFSEFARSQPRVDVDVVLIDHPTNPVEHGFDFVIGAFSETYDGVTDTPLFPLRRMVCGTPSYFDRLGRPKHPRDLFMHNCLVLSPSGANWEFRGKRGVYRIPVHSSFSANDARVLCTAAVAGHGIALLPSYVAVPAIRRGELEQVLTDYTAVGMWFKTFVPDRLTDSRAVVALLDFVREKLSPIPPWERSDRRGR